MSIATRDLKLIGLFFSSRGDRSIPDMNGMDCFVLEMKEADKIIPSGKTVEEFSCGQYPEGVF